MSLTPFDRKAARRAFERAASGYDGHAVLHREIESRLFERLEYHRLKPEFVLDLGCGTGSASRELSHRYPEALVCGLDWSEAMLRQHELHAAPGPLKRRRTFQVCADMHTLPIASRSLELVFSNLALQWSRDLPGLFTELRRVLKPAAILVFSCYGPDTLTELKQAWRTVNDGQHVNDFPDMHDIGDELLHAGFQEPVMDAERITLEYSGLAALMNDLRGCGESNVATHRPRGLTGKARYQKMLDAYGSFRREGRYPASYEIIYGVAFAPADGQPVKTPGGDVATFSVEALRKSKRTKI